MIANNMEQWILPLIIVLAISVAPLPLFPRTLRGTVQATVLAFSVLLILALLGSALVGPVDLSPMLVFGPVSIFCAAIWYLFAVRPKSASHG